MNRAHHEVCMLFTGLNAVSFDLITYVFWMFFKSQQSSPPWALSKWWRVKAVTCHYGNQVRSIARVTDGRSVLTEMSINSSRIATDCTGGGHFVYFTLKLYTHRSDVHVLYSTENTEWEAYKFCMIKSWIYFISGWENTFIQYLFI